MKWFDAVSGGTGTTWSGRPRWAERAATDAAVQLSSGRFGVVTGGRRDAVWRVRPDGVVELARGHSGRIELFEVFSDGTFHRVAASEKSTRKLIASVCDLVSTTALLAGILAFIFVSTGFAAVIFLALVIGPAASALIRWKSQLRPWIRARFGTDVDWTRVPWRIDGSPSTGNQVIALSELAKEKNRLYYHVLADGTLEVADRTKPGQLLTVDKLGVVTVIGDLPKETKLQDLHDPRVTWHRVLSYDPSD